jgi:Dolichyl-phosphate-mannose-protein mannosyltransferase
VSTVETGSSKWWETGTALVVWIAAATVVAHLATGWRYGFDRDELMALDDARHLAWGYVQYPPMTAFLGRVELTLFGTSLVGFRFFAALAQAVALVLTGLMAKELGGGKWAQVVAAMAGVPFCLGAGALMQYISFDYVCWVGVAYCVLRAVKDDNPRWCIAAGAAIGLGMMAKYTMAFLAVGALVGALATDSRKYLRSVWMWLGVLLACGTCAPNFVWEWRRNFISLDFLRFLHARDVGLGLTDWFLPGQLELTLLALPLAVAGLWFYFCTTEGRRFRILGWMYVVPLLMFLVMRGREYYLAPAYPMLYAAGAVWIERKWLAASGGASEWRERNEAACGKLEGISGSLTTDTRQETDNAETRSAQRTAEKTGARQSEWNTALSVGRPAPFGTRHSKNIRRIVWICLVLDIIFAAAVALPMAPVGSRWWNLSSRVVTVFPEEIGWPEFVQAVADVRAQLPEQDRKRLAILAGNYGEVGALNLYGAGFGLPHAISGVNSSWERGYDDPPPDVLIVVGYSREFLEQEFASCVVAGQVHNRLNIPNEETIEDPDIFVCRGLKEPWPEFWRKARRFA